MKPGTKPARVKGKPYGIEEEVGKLLDVLEAPLPAPGQPREAAAAASLQTGWILALDVHSRDLRISCRCSEAAALVNTFGEGGRNGWQRAHYCAILHAATGCRGGKAAGRD